MNYITDKGIASNKKIIEMDDTRFSAAYLGTLAAGAKTDIQELTKMLRWLFTEFNITAVPAAYTDAQVDAIEEDIRTHDDDL